jgi:predicted dehydrogenase
MKLAFVGCGRIASVHLEAVLKYSSKTGAPIEIVALIDSNKANAELFLSKNKLLCPIYTSIPEAIKTTLFDSLIISVPHHLHEAITIQALHENLNILLEKPLAHSLGSAHRILESSKKSTQIFMIGENSQYWPEVLKVQELLSNKIIGDVVTARASFRQASDHDIFDSYNMLPGDLNSKAWRYSKSFTGGGITIDGGAHWIRPLRFWFGEIRETFCKFSYPHPLMEGESLSQAIFDFDNSVTAIFEGILTEKTAFSKDPPFRITGTLGEIIVGPEGYGVYVFNAEHPEGLRVLDDHGYISSFYYQFHDFYSSVANGKTLDASPEYSLGEMRTALAMEKSHLGRTWVSVKDMI